MVSKPYAGTDVSVGKSQGQIDDLLTTRGIRDIRWTSTATLKVVEFHHIVHGEKIGNCSGTTSRACEVTGKTHASYVNHIRRAVRAVLGVRIVLNWSIDEREQRRLMRLLFWMLKSKFEIIDAGLVVFEEEFMPHLTLGQGRRMWDAFAPELNRRIDLGHDLSAGIGEDMLLALGDGQ